MTLPMSSVSRCTDKGSSINITVAHVCCGMFNLLPRCRICEITGNDKLLQKIKAVCNSARMVRRHNGTLFFRIGIIISLGDLRMQNESSLSKWELGMLISAAAACGISSSSCTQLMWLHLLPSSGHFVNYKHSAARAHFLPVQLSVPPPGTSMMRRASASLTGALHVPASLATAASSWTLCRCRARLRLRSQVLMLQRLTPHPNRQLPYGLIA